MVDMTAEINVFCFVYMDENQVYITELKQKLCTSSATIPNTT